MYESLIQSALLSLYRSFYSYNLELDLEKKGVVETSYAWIWPWKGFKEPVIF